MQNNTSVDVIVNRGGDSISPAAQTPIGRWNGHEFEVSPSVIRGWTDMKIKGSCETKVKNKKKQKYVERKYGEVPEVTMSIGLYAYLGIADVYAEAMAFVSEATDGACDYLYLGGGKLFPAQMRLTSAEVIEIVHMPGSGNQWIGCKVNVTFKQGTKNDEEPKKSSSSKKSKKKKSTKDTGTNTQTSEKLVDDAMKVENSAKETSAATKSATAGNPFDKYKG